MGPDKLVLFFFKGDRGSTGARGQPGDPGPQGAKVRDPHCGRTRAVGVHLPSMLSYEGRFLDDCCFYLSGYSVFCQIHISTFNLLSAPCVSVCVCETSFLWYCPSRRETRGFQVQGASQEKKGTREQMCVAFKIRTVQGETLAFQHLFAPRAGRPSKVEPVVAGHCGKPRRSRIEGRTGAPWTKGSVTSTTSTPTPWTTANCAFLLLKGDNGRPGFNYPGPRGPAVRLGPRGTPACPRTCD